MRKKNVAGTKFLDGKYTNKKKLGRGAFGDVFLVTDEKGQEVALKMISKEKLSGDNEDMLIYLQEEIQCMRVIKGKNMVDLYDLERDDEYYYMVLEYCDGGDLVNIQAKLDNMVFPLDMATEYLSQVISGLEQIHKNGYLHRDIKPQNVLLKNENGEKILKIADFGFAKKARNNPETCLGT